MKKTIHVQELAGGFAENKDIAKKIRIEEILPALASGDEVILDFAGVQGATQSFIHALISDPIREFKNSAFNNLVYKSANDEVREIISIVYRYLQESLGEIEENNL